MQKWGSLWGFQEEASAAFAGISRVYYCWDLPLPEVSLGLLGKEVSSVRRGESYPSACGGREKPKQLLGETEHNRLLLNCGTVGEVLGTPVPSWKSRYKAMLPFCPGQGSHAEVTEKAGFAQDLSLAERAQMPS